MSARGGKRLGVPVGSLPLPRRSRRDAVRSAALLDAVRAVAPELVRDGALDLDGLRALLAGATLPERQSYELSWAGKREAREAAFAPVTTTLHYHPEQSLDGERTRNLMLVGENLEALKHLARTEQGTISLIYIDPPYNTGNGFVFADHYAAKRGRATTDSATPGGTVCRDAAPGDIADRHHARWLSLLYPRLLLARELLCPSGAICVSIGDEEYPRLRVLLDEVFGEHNYRNTLAVRRHDKNLSLQFMAHGLPSLAVGFEYIVIYARGPAFVMRPSFRQASERRRAYGYWKSFWNTADRPTMRYELLGVLPETGQWKWARDVAHEAVRNYQRYLETASGRVSLETYWAETGGTQRFIRRNSIGQGKNRGIEHWIPPGPRILRTTNWTDLLASESLARLDLAFDNPKNVDVLEALFQLCAGPDASVLDFFAGSGSTAEAVLRLNAADDGTRRFVLAQSEEPTGDPLLPTIADICIERIRRVAADQRASAEHNRHDTGFRVYTLDACDV